VPFSVTRARVAVTAVFFLNGAVFASWYSRLPDIQADLGIGTGALGLALLGAPVGLLLSQPIAGGFTSSAGSRPVVTAAAFGLSAVVLPAVAFSAPSLALATLIVGAANGVLDISMNVQGLSVERVAGKRLFNSLHAAFSFGALAGAAGGGVAASVGLDPLPYLTIVAGIGMAGALVASRGLLPPSEEPRSSSAPRLARPTRRLAVLGIVAFCVLLSEGAVFDWSGIYLATETDAAAILVPAGLAAFNLAMGFTRLAADRASDALGSVALGRWGALVAFAGLALALLTQTPAGAIAGFGVMGVGVAALFPLALRAAGHDPRLAGPSVAAVSTLGYMGFLAGPPTIGLLAELIGLSNALACVCVLLAVVGALAGHLHVRAPAAS